MLLGAESQRIEYLALELIGTHFHQDWMLRILADWKEHERGAIPGPTESCILIFILSNTKLTDSKYINTKFTFYSL